MGALGPRKAMLVLAGVAIGMLNIAGEDLGGEGVSY